MGERVGVIAVNSHLGDEDVGGESSNEGKDDLAEGPQVQVVLGIGVERDVDRVSGAVSRAGLGGEAGPGEKIASRFVHGDGEHPGVVEEGFLDSVAVVGVDVHVGDALPVVEEVLDGDNRIVEDAEPGGVSGGGVMEPPGDVVGHIDLSAKDKLGGDQGSAGAEEGGVVHPGVNGVVARGAEPVPFGAVSRETEAEAADGGEVVGRVEELDLLLGGGPGTDEAGVRSVEGPVGVEQVEGVLQANGAHGVVVAEDVTGEGFFVNKGGAGHGASPDSFGPGHRLDGNWGGA